MGTIPLIQTHRSKLTMFFYRDVIHQVNSFIWRNYQNTLYYNPIEKWSVTILLKLFAVLYTIIPFILVYWLTGDIRLSLRTLTMFFVADIIYNFVTGK